MEIWLFCCSTFRGCAPASRKRRTGLFMASKGYPSLESKYLLSRYQGIAFVDSHYDYVHTQSFASMVNDMAEYCHKNGGALV